MRYGSLSDKSNQWLPLPPREQGEFQLRSPEALTASVVALAPDHSKRYAARPGITWCKTFASDYCAYHGVLFPHWISPTTWEPSDPSHVDARETRANDMPIWLARSGVKHGWLKCEGGLKEARPLAEEGLIVVGCWVNQQGGPGHVVAAVPGGFAQAGAQNYQRASLDQCIRAEHQAQMTWWAHG